MGLKEFGLKYFMKFKPRELTWEEFFDYFFDPDNRTIDIYLPKTVFNIPGLYIVKHGTKLKDVIDKRNVGRRGVLFVRHDKRKPNIYEVMVSQNYLEDSWFELTVKEWESIKGKLINTTPLKLRRSNQSYIIGQNRRKLERAGLDYESAEWFAKKRGKDWIPNLSHSTSKRQD